MKITECFYENKNFRVLGNILRKIAQVLKSFNLLVLGDLGMEWPVQKKQVPFKKLFCNALIQPQFNYANKNNKNNKTLQKISFVPQ